MVSCLLIIIMSEESSLSDEAKHIGTTLASFYSANSPKWTISSNRIEVNYCGSAIESIMVDILPHPVWNIWTLNWNS